MCGIVGLFIKDPKLEPKLGALLSEMTSTLCSRGPDSAGFAIYGNAIPGATKLVLAGPDIHYDIKDLARRLSTSIDRDGNAADCDIEESRRRGAKAGHTGMKIDVRHSHAVVTVENENVERIKQWLEENAPEINIVSEGERLEIFKEAGFPTKVADAFGLDRMAGTHGISHTRMATESSVTMSGSHPFSTGTDQCLVHNGSLSNHASLRRELRRDGIKIRTENDSEVAAGYLSRQMRDGQSLGEALTSSLDDLDGFFTFVVGTENGFGVLRDPIACKPAVMAETDQYVAFASEYKTLTCLPGIEKAKVWEPKPATVYFWERTRNADG